MVEIERTANQDVARRPESGQVAQQETRAAALRPPVDIFEDDNAIHVLADVPGVTTESLKVEVDNDLLTLEGDIHLDMPEGLSASYAEVRGSRYQRQFRLGREVDAEGIRAEVRNGVLDLVLPKRDTHRRRRIEVSSG